MRSIPVIIDTDIGTDIDDTWALAMALGSPELDIKLITTCTGDTELRAKIVCKFLEAAGRTDIPVAIGPKFEPGREMQANWVSEYQLADYPGEVFSDAAAAINQVVNNVEDKVTLVAIGPLPNIADLLTRYPESASAIRFIGMHGSVYKGYFGSDEVHAEYNVKAHTEDAQQVFSSGLDMTITPLDSCGVVRLKGDSYQQVYQHQSATLAALFDNYRVWLTAINKPPTIAQEKSSVLFDTVAVYLAYNDSLLTMETLKIAVDDEGFTRVVEDGKVMQVATGWHSLDQFYNHLVERLSAAP